MTKKALFSEYESNKINIKKERKLERSKYLYTYGSSRYRRGRAHGGRTCKESDDVGSSRKDRRC
jgi:hypothetical protein